MTTFQGNRGLAQTGTVDLATSLSVGGNRNAQITGAAVRLARVGENRPRCGHLLSARAAGQPAAR